MTRALVAMAALAVAAQARAAEPGCADAKSPWIAVDADASLAADAGRVRRELRADLGPEDLAVCDGSRAGTPVARILLSAAAGGNGVSIRLEIRDALTQKEIARTLGTANIPSDGRALAIALAAAELLRASWAELALRSAPQPAMPLPAPVTRIVRASLAPAPAAPTPGPVALEIALAGEAFTSGSVRGGADARLAVDVGPRFAAAARVGFRRALSTTVPDGTIDADALLFGVEASVAFARRPSRWNVDVLARLDVALVTFHATPAPGVGATSATVASVEASAGLRASVALTPSFGLFVEGGAGGPLVAATARDGASTVAGTDGVLLFAALGARGNF